MINKKGAGIALLIAAGIVFVVAFGMPVEAGGAGGRGIANLDLMNMRTNLFITASSFLISGVILISAVTSRETNQGVAFDHRAFARIEAEHPMSSRRTTVSEDSGGPQVLEPQPTQNTIAASARSTSGASDVIVEVYKNNKIKRNAFGNYYVMGDASIGKLFASVEAAKNSLDRELGDA